MNNAFSIDWLTVTIPMTEKGFFPQNYAPEDRGAPQEIPSRRPYNQGVQVGDAKIYWHNDHPEFKVMVVLDGQALKSLRSRNIDGEFLNEWIVRHGGRVSRVDFAADIFDCEGSPIDIFHAWETDQLMTTSQSVSMIVSGRHAKGGATTYIGSRHSERFIRVYDKGKEQKTDLDWIRVEIELKGARAQQAMGLTRDIDAKTCTLNTIRDAVEWSDVAWFEALWECEYDDIEIDAIGRPETDHERWIRTVCLPAIERAAKSGMMGIEHALRGIIEDIDRDGIHGN